MKKSKPTPKKAKNKGGRPRKAAPEFREGSEAAKRFAAGMRFVIAGGPQPSEKEP